MIIMTLPNPEQLEGKDATAFAERHLRKLEMDGLNCKIAYEDPTTGESG
jgi:hypothetical protein